jgi:hypothetical protein
LQQVISLVTDNGVSRPDKGLLAQELLSVPSSTIGTNVNGGG